MDFLTSTYLFYIFVSFYFFFLFFLIYIQNIKLIYESLKFDKIRSLSIVVPCYNEEKSIAETIESLLASDYPGLEKIYVVDDCSKDNSYKIIQDYARRYPKVIALQTPKNTGKASGSKNYGAKFVTTELIGFTDADSYPKSDAISRMVGFFNDEKTGAVTSRVLVKNKVNFLTWMQAIEYKSIAFTRKLLGFVESIYVTNGPLSIYRKKAFDEVNGFDEKNLTEDIEITWHFVKNSWKVHMSIPALVYTVAPTTFKAWIKQRIRWNVGGIQTMNKYKNTFFRCGMLGKFILPFFLFSWIIGIIGLLFLFYRFFQYIFVKILTMTYSVQAQVALIEFHDFSLSPNILIFYGIILFVLGFGFMLIGLAYSKEKEFKNQSIFQILEYSFFYILMTPLIWILSLYKYLKGKNTW